MTTEPFLRFFLYAFDETIFMVSVPELLREKPLHLGGTPTEHCQRILTAL